MPLRADYTTIAKVRAAYLDSTSTGQDAFLLDIIRDTSREMDLIANRHFYPRIVTRYYDTPEDTTGELQFDDDLLALTTLTNGDAVVLTEGTNFKLFPYNESPKAKVTFIPTSGKQWATSSGSPVGAISLAGIWGWHGDYTNAWDDTLAVLAAAITTTSAASFTCTTGLLVAGMLIKIDSEYMYVSSVATGAPDTPAVVRGVNGSTAATHLISAPIYVWLSTEVEMIARVATVAYYRLRNNPVGEVVQIGDASFQTPKDVTQYMTRRMGALGMLRLEFA